MTDRPIRLGLPWRLHHYQPLNGAHPLVLSFLEGNGAVEPLAITPVAATVPRETQTRVLARMTRQAHQVPDELLTSFLDWLSLPAEADDACLLAIKGAYCFGLLRAEAGLHRLKDEDLSSVCRVRVGPWLDLDEAPVWGEARTLRGPEIAVPGGPPPRLRSSLEVRWRGQGRRPALVLRGDRSLEEARALAQDLLGAWSRMPAPSERPVRRYDAAAGQVKDHHLGLLATAPARLGGDALHRILLDRLDGAQEAPTDD